MGKALEEILMQIEISILRFMHILTIPYFSQDKLAEILLNVYLF